MQFACANLERLYEGKKLLAHKNPLHKTETETETEHLHRHPNPFSYHPLQIHPDSIPPYPYFGKCYINSV